MGEEPAGPWTRRRAPVVEVQRLVLDRIRSGALAPGGPAPSTRHLAVELGLAPATVLRAYTRLAAGGRLVRTAGIWTVAAPQPADPRPPGRPLNETPPVPDLGGSPCPSPVP